MSNFIIAVGHTASGNVGCGAVDLLDESNCTREIAPLVVQYLQNKGHSATLLRIDKSNSYNCEDCFTRANQANSIGADLYAEIHLNSGKERTGDGTEVCVTGKSSIASEYATRVCDKLSNVLGIDNRGLKVENLIVLNKTSMPAILIECMFVDCNNSSKYNADTIAKAIVEGLINEDISSQYKQGWGQSTYNGKWYYYTNTNGNYYKDQWAKIDGYWFHFDKDGYMQIGWLNDNDDWFYLNPVSDGTMGRMKTGWIQYKNKWCYLEEQQNGNQGMAYCNCITTINGKQYSFDKDCYLIENK